MQAPTAPVFPAQRCKHSLCATEANLPCLHQNLHLLLLPACRNQATLSAIAQQLSALEKLQPAAPTALSALLGPSALLCPHWVAQSLLSPTTSGSPVTSRSALTLGVLTRYFPTGAGAFRSLLQYWAVTGQLLQCRQAHQEPSVQQCPSLCLKATAAAWRKVAFARPMATGATHYLTFAWASAESRPSTMMSTSRELQQKVGFWAAGALASTEGVLAHLAALGITAALVQDCPHHRVPASSLRLQLWSTWPAQHSPYHQETSPYTFMLTTSLIQSAMLCNPTSLPGIPHSCCFRPGLCFPRSQDSAPPSACPLTC